MTTNSPLVIPLTADQIRQTHDRGFTFTGEDGKTVFRWGRSGSVLMSPVDVTGDATEKGLEILDFLTCVFCGNGQDLTLPDDARLGLCNTLEIAQALICQDMARR
uniref:Uncharacterized protein n=1 Tax=Candidatus Kentrum sp. FM TaxID=2126340 RepID=A0A450RWU9_9GAMM|nr:MAG: hypothetical protein BECKFM1743A_GA0114220_100033 [Candidatus Kentron sp. FM]VFJ43600.1 MAG: hypothetical protein BECKFM1743C_GA0114222_100033 [Candidatus Kentron sp. FM]VFK05630.1 MAG: hypothetical protein BECKFM1743B_GA0114221_100033 [Candidatus Kentron sp. FM]